jgi:3-deoxy-D-manno-octulosonic-acid transferase
MGPRIDRAVEAGELTEAGGAWIIRSADELEFAWRRHLDDASERESSTQRARDYIESGAGAAERSLNFLEKIEN